MEGENICRKTSLFFWIPAKHFRSSLCARSPNLHDVFSIHPHKLDHNMIVATHCSTAWSLSKLPAWDFFGNDSLFPSDDIWLICPHIAPFFWIKLYQRMKARSISMHDSHKDHLQQSGSTGDCPLVLNWWLHWTSFAHVQQDPRGCQCQPLSGRIIIMLFMHLGPDPLDIGIDIHDIRIYLEFPTSIVIFNINKYQYKYLFRYLFHF